MPRYTWEKDEVSGEWIATEYTLTKEEEKRNTGIRLGRQPVIRGLQGLKNLENYSSKVKRQSAAFA